MQVTQITWSRGGTEAGPEGSDSELPRCAGLIRKGGQGGATQVTLLLSHPPWL